MATLSVAGIGSGLDVNSLLEQIVEAERAPTENRLNIKEAELQAELTAYGTLNGSLSSFQSSLGSLKSSSAFNTKDVNIGNDDLFAASATSIADAGNYNVEVSQLAQAHSLTSVAYDNLTDVIGTGTLTFEFGTTTYDAGTDTYTSFVDNEDLSSESIVIDSSNNTVEGVRDAINDANMGVNASIIFDGSGYRLLITSENTGAETSLKVSVDEGGLPAENEDTIGLSQLAFNINATNLEQTQAGQDANVSINGLAITRDTNSIVGAIPGVTLTLLSTDAGNPTQLTISQSESKATDSIRNFVNAYNELVTALNDYTNYDSETGQGGILLGDNTTRTITSQIRRELGETISGLSGPYNSLYQIGISTQSDGTLAIDDNKLNDAVSEDLSAVGELFSATGTLSDDDINFINASYLTQQGQYDINISQLATQGELVGNTIGASVTIDASNDSLSLSIDGISVSISLTQNTYTGVELAQEIQNRINSSSTLIDADISTTVSFDTDHLVITSNTYGSDSKVSVTSDYADLGITTSSTITDGVDVAGTINGSEAVGDGQFLTGKGAVSGLMLEITGGATGNRGTINYTLGYAGQLDNLLSRMLSDDGLLTSKTNSLQSQVDNIGEQRTQLAERVAVIEDRYRRQFTQLDVLLGSLQTTSEYLTQQLDSLPDISVGRN